MTLSFKIMEEILNVLDEDEFHDQKAIRRNAEKNAKGHAYKAKQLENRSIKAAEAGKERTADNLYDKANAEWDKETAEQERAAQAHSRVEQLRKYNRNEALEIMEEILNVVEGRKEGESLEDFKKRLGDKEFNKQYDKYVDLTKKVIYSDKHDRRHRPHRGMSQRTHDLEAERNKAFTKKELAGAIASGATSWPYKSKSREERMYNDYNDLKS